MGPQLGEFSRYSTLVHCESSLDDTKTFIIGSTHGTYHNKNKCFAKTYYRFRVGHGVKFGGSTRLLILQGPENDMEDESDLSVTELKEKALEKARLKGAVRNQF